MEKWKIWGKGLLSAVIGGAVSAVPLVVIEPVTFNLFQGGAKRLATVMATTALVAVAMYMKKSPLPGLKEIATVETESGSLS